MKSEETMKVLITGGAGFIGSYIAQVLNANGHHVTIYDKKDGYDILDRDKLKKTMIGHDIVIHCAAIAGIYKTTQNIKHTIATNLIGTQHVVNIAEKNDVKLVVNFSTSEVYGPYVYDGDESIMTTQGPIDEGRWAYATSKLAGEYFTKYSDCNYVNIRPFNIFGPGQWGEGAVHDMIRAAIEDKPIIIYDNGTQIRSWCYISDLVDTILVILANEKQWNNVYNIGNPRNTITVFNLAKTIIRMTESKSTMDFRRYPGSEVKVRVPNIEKAQNLLGFNPKVDLDEGLEKTIAFYMLERETL